MSHELSWSGNEVIISFTGVVDFHEITEVDDKIYGDPRFEEQKYQIWDFSGIESFNLSSIEARVIGGIDSRTSLWNDDIRLAVVSKDKHVIEMTREYQESMKATNWQIRMFDTFHEAYAWAIDPSQPA